MKSSRRPGLRFPLANHVHGLPFDPPRRGEQPRLRAKSAMTEGSGTTVAEGIRHTLHAIRRLQQRLGTVVVVAAGNSRERFPAEHLAPDSDLTVVVGALDLGGRPAWFSSSDYVQLWAPGVDVLSSFVYWNGPAAMDPLVDDVPLVASGPFAGWARWDGTSFAVPAVAGAIATAIGNRAEVADVRERRRLGLFDVLSAARDIDADGVKGRALTALPVALIGPPIGTGEA